MPRLLSFQDRNPFSATYGCFFREYWHEKIVDFPNAHFQCAVYSLALAYSRQMPGNIYHASPAVLEWVCAGLDFAADIQHGDGSFDEFYPNERGRAVTAILLYSFLGALREVGGNLSAERLLRYKTMCDRAAAFVSSFSRQQTGLLANHFTMIMCALVFHWQAYGDGDSLQAYERYRDEFLEICDAEGWSLEYDGPDMGYLSATVSYLAKLLQVRPDPLLDDVLSQAVEYCSHFVYPNGYYAGSMGSRQTLHFYPHGFEYFGADNPLAQACAEKMLRALVQGKLVPPAIQSDRYVYYRVEEYLLSYLDFSERREKLPPLPSEGADFRRYFPNSRIVAVKQGDIYILCNLGRGGVLKIFKGDKLIHNDAGVHMRCGGKVYTSQWVDPDYSTQAALRERRFAVSGSMHRAPAQLFTPWKMALFKLVSAYLVRNRTFADKFKAAIRKVLILGASSSEPASFTRSFSWDEGQFTILTTLNVKKMQGAVELAGLGGEVHQRFVPQSRYFQPQELETETFMLPQEARALLNAGQEVMVETRVDLKDGGVENSIQADSLISV